MIFLRKIQSNLLCPYLKYDEATFSTIFIHSSHSNFISYEGFIFDHIISDTTIVIIASMSVFNCTI